MKNLFGKVTGKTHMPPAKRRKTRGAEMKPKSKPSERKPLPVTILSGFLVVTVPRKI